MLISSILWLFDVIFGAPCFNENVLLIFKIKMRRTFISGI